jgi:hypothetical protein
MKRTILTTLAVAAFVCAVTTATNAQEIQFPIPTTAAEVPGPPPGTAMTTPYVQAVGRMAYL